jgi:hypothetical protein
MRSIPLHMIKMAVPAQQRHTGLANERGNPDIIGRNRCSGGFQFIPYGGIMRKGWRAGLEKIAVGEKGIEPWLELVPMRGTYQPIVILTQTYQGHRDTGGRGRAGLEAPGLLLPVQTRHWYRGSPPHVRFDDPIILGGESLFERLDGFVRHLRERVDPRSCCQGSRLILKKPLLKPLLHIPGQGLPP